MKQAEELRTAGAQKCLSYGAGYADVMLILQYSGEGVYYYRHLKWPQRKSY